MMLGSLLGSRPQNVLSVETSTWGVWPGDENAPSRIGDDDAMQLMAVYGSVKLIVDGVSTLPVDVFDVDGDGRQVPAVAPRWLAQPTPELDYESWASQVLTSLLLHGNAYLQVGRDQQARVSTVLPLDPEEVSTERDSGSGRLLYRHHGRMLPVGSVVHIRGMMLPGSDVGLSPVEYARRTVGLGLNAVDYGSDFFVNEGNMSGVIELPHAATPDTLSNLAKQWQRKRRQGGKGLPGVLQAGAQWKPTGINHEQMQFLATRKFTAAEIAGQMFLVDPTDLGIGVEGQNLTYSNLQQRNTRRVQVTFLPWIIRLERAMSSLTYGPNRFVKLNVDGLLRGDQQARFGAYQTGLANGFLTIDEVRQLEDLPPLTNEEP